MKCTNYVTTGMNVESRFQNVFNFRAAVIKPGFEKWLKAKIDIKFWP